MYAIRSYYAYAIVVERHVFAPVLAEVLVDRDNPELVGTALHLARLAVDPFFFDHSIRPGDVLKGSS